MSVSSQETGGVLPEGCKGGKEGNMVMDNGMQQLKAGNGDEQCKKIENSMGRLAVDRANVYGRVDARVRSVKTARESGREE